MKLRPKILITNDDGVEAPGLRYLAEALLPFADCTVIAPASEQSGMGASITLHNELTCKEIQWDTSCCTSCYTVWSVTGTPADCVKIGLSVILQGTLPTLVVSGINRGGNH